MLFGGRPSGLLHEGKLGTAFSGDGGLPWASLGLRGLVQEAAPLSCVRCWWGFLVATTWAPPGRRAAWAWSLGRETGWGSLYFRLCPAQLALLAAEDTSQEHLGLGGVCTTSRHMSGRVLADPVGSGPSQGRCAQHLVPRQSSIPKGGRLEAQLMGVPAGTFWRSTEPAWDLGARALVRGQPGAWLGSDDRAQWPSAGTALGRDCPQSTGSALGGHGPPPEEGPDLQVQTQDCPALPWLVTWGSGPPAQHL